MKILAWSLGKSFCSLSTLLPDTESSSVAVCFVSLGTKASVGYALRVRLMVMVVVRVGGVDGRLDEQANRRTSRDLHVTE